MTDRGSQANPVEARGEGPPQHPIWWSIVLHLLPGAVLTVFILLAAPVVSSLGFPAVFALFVGIGLVIVPIELGILLVHARRTTGSFGLESTVRYREPLPLRRVVTWGGALAIWFLVFFAASTVLLDAWIARTFFWWMPETILQFSAVEEVGEPIPTTTLVAFFVVAFVMNGFVGPIVEEYYFRGYLLPRLERYGRWAPLINTVLFSVYHFWTPWQNLARIVGFLPIAQATRRFRSIQVAIVAHVTINLLGLLGMLALFLEAS